MIALWILGGMWWSRLPILRAPAAVDGREARAIPEGQADPEARVIPEGPAVPGFLTIPG